MLKKLNALSVRAYVKGSAFLSDLRNGGRRFLDDERGLSGVVVAVLLILIAVLLIAAMWGSLSKWLGGLWSDIVGSTNDMTKQTWNTPPV